jgi:hypothetical protein
MTVVPLTLTISLCLVFTFVVFFLREHSRRRFSGAERDSLLPLAAETPRVVPAPADSRHRPAAGGCGCADGARAPCAGCLKTRAAAPAPARLPAPPSTHVRPKNHH